MEIRRMSLERTPEPEYMDLPEEAQAYAAADFSDVNSAFVDRLCELAPENAPCWAIDLGAGPGDIARRMAVRRPDWRIAAVDVSRPMLAYAQRTRANTVWPLCCDVKRLPFPDHFADVLMSNSILHHMPAPLPLWREMLRIGRPGALVFFRDLARPESADAAAAIVARYAADESELLREEYYRSLLAAFTVQEVREQLDCLGIGEKLTVEMASDRHLDVHGALPA